MPQDTTPLLVSFNFPVALGAGPVGIMSPMLQMGKQAWRERVLGTPHLAKLDPTPHRLV